MRSHRLGSLRPGIRLAALAGALALPAAMLAAHGLSARLPVWLWPQALLAPDLADPRQLVVAYGWLPRMVAGLACGAALGLAGFLFQTVTRNPLAEPATLGASGGAYLALAIAGLATSHLAYAGRELVALSGSALSTLVVFAIALRQTLAPVMLVLAGLIVSLACSSLASALTLFVNPYDLSLFLWGAGSFAGADWSAVVHVLAVLGGSALAVVLIQRPLGILALDEAGARGLGVPVISVRLIALGVAIALSASVTAAVGVVAFVGLAAPTLARFAGARTARSLAIWSPLVGAGLLWLTDSTVSSLSGGGREFIPTGAATALFGAPVLLWLIAVSRAQPAMPPAVSVEAVRRLARPWLAVVAMMLLVAVAAWLSVSVGRTLQGWTYSPPDASSALFVFRGPRLLGAAAAGAMLAAAGAMMQRLTGNAVAGPEILGIGSGASLALVLLTAYDPGTSDMVRIMAMSFGALLTLGLLLGLGRRSAFSPQRFLLAGIGLSAFLNVAVVAAMASGDSHLAALRVWMAGSTNLVTARQAVPTALAGAVLIGMSLLTARWLGALSLGSPLARSVGVPVARARLTILLLIAMLTAVATLAIGPLGFVGLMGPHMARLAGFQRPAPHVVGAALIGALTMIVSDWMARSIAFPYQVPAGLIASLIGTAYLLSLMRRRVG